MKRGELCETCGGFCKGNYHVIPCSVCGKDMCNHCANEQLCPECFRKHGQGTLGYEPFKEANSDIAQWKKSPTNPTSQGESNE